MGKKKGTKTSVTKDIASGASPAASVQTATQAAPQRNRSGDTTTPVSPSFSPAFMSLANLVGRAEEANQTLPIVLDAVQRMSGSIQYAIQARADNHNIAIENAHRLASFPTCYDPLKLPLHPLVEVQDMANPEIPGFPSNLAELEALDDKTATSVLKAITTIRPSNIIKSNTPRNLAYKKTAIRSRWIAVLPTVHEFRKVRRGRCRHPRSTKSGHRASASWSFYGPEPEHETVQGNTEGSQTQEGPVSKCDVERKRLLASIRKSIASTQIRDSLCQSNRETPGSPTSHTQAQTGQVPSSDSGVDSTTK